MDIAVVGSINQDVTVTVPRHPRPGETILGRERFENPGGKGANQAVAARRLGRDVAMVGRVGDDPYGHALRTHLAELGVDTSCVRTDPETGTGMAFITLSEDGENSIVVDPGANGRVDTSDIAAAATRLTDATITLVQLEVPDVAVTTALQAARGRRILNPAPARPLPTTLLANVDIIVPNRSELATLAGAPEAATVDAAVAQARRADLAACTIITLGSQGAVLVDGDTVEHIPAPRITPVDTTGAGDAFCGALADALARGESMRDAVHWAVHAGALATTCRGAIPSLPDAAAVRELAQQHRS